MADRATLLRIAMFRRRLRSSPLKKQEGKSLRDHLPLWLSATALIISSFTFYTTFLYQSDDIALIVHETPLATFDYDKGGFRLSGSLRLSVTNRGTRAAGIHNIMLLADMRRPEIRARSNECNPLRSAHIGLDFEPFVVKPSEIAPKQFKLESAGFAGNIGLPRHAIVTNSEVLLIDYDKSNQQHKHVTTCLHIQLSTPEEASLVAMLPLTHSRFPTTKPKLEFGGFFGTGTLEYIAREPITLTRRTANRFPWPILVGDRGIASRSPPSRAELDILLSGGSGEQHDGSN